MQRTSVHTTAATNSFLPEGWASTLAAYLRALPSAEHGQKACRHLAWRCWLVPVRIYSFTQMKQLTTLLLALIFIAGKPADDHFTAAEMQQISIATPGLFDKGDVFYIDLTAIGHKNFAFPLPVGKSKAIGGDVLEITTQKGDAVKAMLPGRVRLARKNKQWGNVVVIRHDNGLETVYAHNAQNLVKPNQMVEAGQSIAIVGTKSGKGRMALLTMVNGGRINPLTIIDIYGQKLHKTVLRFEKKGHRVLVRQATEKDLEEKVLAEKKAKDDEKKARKEEEKAKKEEAKRLKEEWASLGIPSTDDFVVVVSDIEDSFLKKV